MASNIMDALNLKCAEELLPQIEAVLEKLESESFEDMLLYDVKNEWISEIVESANNKMRKIQKDFCIEAQKARPLQKMCCYKISSSKIDCDVALRSVVIYALAYGFQQYKIEQQDRCSDKFRLMGNGFEFIGDTMNSYATSINEFLRIYGDDKNDPKLLEINQGKRNQGKFMTSKVYSEWEECILAHDTYFNDVLLNSAHEFIRLNHTIGNLVPVPCNFNMPRNAKTNDYWDITLDGIYKWFVNNDKNSNVGIEDIVGRSVKYTDTNENLRVCRQWLSLYTSWDDFVDKNFMQDFVTRVDDTDSYGSPKELWQGHFASRNLPKEKIEFEQFFTNASACILARGSRIVSKMKMELENAKVNL